MTFLVVKLFLTFIISHQIHQSSQQPSQTTRFKSLKCIADNASALIVRYCRVKVTRNASFLAINMTFLQTFGKPLIFKSALLYKYGNIYRQVVRVPDFEFCSAMKNFEMIPPFAKAIFDVFGESFKLIMKGCPFNGDVDLMVALDDWKWPSIFPSGMYKAEVTVNSVSPQYIVIGGSFEMEVKSSILTSF